MTSSEACSTSTSGQPEVRAPARETTRLAPSLNLPQPASKARLVERLQRGTCPSRAPDLAQPRSRSDPTSRGQEEFVHPSGHLEWLGACSRRLVRVGEQ